MVKVKTVIAAAVAGLFVIGFSSMALGKNRFEREVDKEKSAVRLVREVQRGGYDVITTEELKRLIDSGREIRIIDTMPYRASYKKAHVPGAKNFLFPVPEMETWDTKKTDGKTKEEFQALLGPDKDIIIIIYCGFVKSTRSHNGAMWAKKLEYKNVYRYPGGIYAWKGAKYETEKVK